MTVERTSQGASAEIRSTKRLILGIAAGLVLLMAIGFVVLYNQGRKPAALADAILAEQSNGSSVDSARIAATRSMIDSNGNVSFAIALYRKHVGAYPSKLSDLISMPNASAEGWNGPYIEDRRSLNDAWGNTIYYRAPGADGAPYDLWSAGPDGKSGTSDDVKPN